MFNERQIKIIQYLHDNKDWLKCDVLATLLHVSMRTIRNDINVINKTTKLIQSSKVHGYTLDFSAYQEFCNKNKVQSYPTQDRLIYILKSLIINQEVCFHDLCECLFISESSLINDLNLLMKKLDITINRNKSMLSINCNDVIENELTYRLIKTLNDSYDIDVLDMIFDNIFKDIRNVVIEVTNQYRYAQRYFELDSIVLIIYYAIYCEDKPNANHDNEMIENIIDNINDKLHIKIKSYYLYQYFNKINKMQMIEQQILNHQFHEDDEYQYCHNLIMSYKTLLHFNVKNSNHSIIEDLSLHLRIAIERARLNVQVFNPLSKSLAIEYPYLFSTAIMIAKDIDIKFGINLNEQEVSFIVTYLSTAIQKMKIVHSTFNQINIIIYEKHNRSILNYIYKEVEALCEHDNIILHKINSQLQLNKFIEDGDNLDLIISINELIDIETIIPIIQISNGFCLVDKIRICREIDVIKQKRHSFKYREICDYTFDKELFFTNVKCQNKEEVIDYCCKVLNEKGYVNDGFKDSVYKREATLSTDIETGIAFPHALDYYADKTGLLVVVLDKPIMWNYHKVQVVLMGCVKKDRAYIFNYLMEYLSRHLFCDQFKKDIIKCQSYEMFISMINELDIEFINNIKIKV